MAKPSLRTVAEACGVSTATVSRALASHRSVKPATRQRIVAAARRHGYDRNDLVGKLMAHVRSGREQRFVGNLAVIHVPSPGEPRLLPAHRRIIAGAKARAQELGFQLYDFSVADGGLAPGGLARVLRARGVQGVIFIFTAPTDAMADFPWDNFATIEIDYGRREPFLHTVCLDHFMTLSTALARLHAQGYRRMGLFLERYKDARIAHKWSAAFRSFQEQTLAGPPIPVLAVERMNEADFGKWYRAHRPDLVLGHFAEAPVWLRRLGVAVPETASFFNLNWTMRKRACAGLDVRLELQGSVAVENLVAQIHRNERGLPADPRTIMVTGRWVDGPTLRRAPWEKRPVVARARNVST